jgi:hypothetical protein
MISQQSKSVAERAKLTYSERLKRDLEAKHRGQFVAVEPDSGEHYLANSFGQAVAAARAAYPDRISFVIRIGHEAAIHLGGMTN